MEINFIYEDESEPTLVAVREFFLNVTTHDKIIFATISPGAHVKVPIKRNWNRRKVNGKIPYSKLPQKLQFDYCIRMLKNAYNYSKDTEIYGCWELNKQGNVHLHFLFYDPLINNDIMIQILRRDVLNSELVFKNLSKNMVDYCNNIVFINDSVTERLKYIHKCNNIGKPFPFFTTIDSPFKPVEKDGKGSDMPLGESVPRSVGRGDEANPPTNSSSSDSEYFDAVYNTDLDAIIYNENIYKKALIV